MTSFAFLKKLLEYVNGFFLIYLIGYSTFMFLTVVVGSSELYSRYRQKRMKSALTDDYYIPISIIVPAYNEEITVVDTVRSLLALDYHHYEIIVVDDGSSDATSQKLIDAFSMKPIRRPIRRLIDCQPEEFVYETDSEKVFISLIRKRNGGKADALNMGINACRYPYFICMDADSVLQYDSLSKIIEPVLKREDVVAVGGAVRPANGVKLENGRVKSYHMPKNFLAAMQVLEYDRSFLASRILFDKFNGSMIISGAFGLFKKDVVVAAGGYDHSTMGEDMELVVKLHEYCLSNRIPYSIKYATDAVCWSQAPERFKDLCKQRRRWHIGLFQTLWQHKGIMIRPEYGPISILSYLYFLIYELMSPFVELLGAFTMALAFVLGLVNLPFMIMFLSMYAVYGCVLTMTAFFAQIYTSELSISLHDVCKSLVLCFFEVFFLHAAMNYVRATAFFGYKKRRLSWGQIERKKLDLQ